MTLLYYTAPSSEVFEEIRAAAREVWQSFDNTHGCVDEELATVNRIANVGDNWMYMIAMFDSPNQVRLYNKLSSETNSLIRKAIEELR